MGGGAVPISINYTATALNNGQLLSFTTSTPPFVAYTATAQSGLIITNPTVLPAVATEDGDLIVVAIAVFNGADLPATITDTAGNSYQSAASYLASASGVYELLYYYAENATGNPANVITVTFNGTASGKWVFAWGIRNATIFNSFDTTAHASATGTTITSSAFTTADPVGICLLVCQGGNSIVTYSPPPLSGYVLDHGGDVSNNNLFGAEHLVFTTQLSGATGSIDLNTSHPCDLFLTTWKGDPVVTLTLPTVPPFPKWTIEVENKGPGTLVINPNGLQIDGNSGNISLASGQGLAIYTDGLNYYSQAGTSAGFVNPMTSAGDIIFEDVSLLPDRLAIGTAGQVLTVSGGLPAWETPFTSPLTTTGDLLYENATPAPARLAIGSTGQVLTVAAGLPSWAAAAGFANPMTTVGDIIIGGSSGAPTRLPIGTTGYVLTVSGGSPAWAAAGGGGGTGGASPLKRRWGYSATGSGGIGTAGNFIGDQFSPTNGGGNNAPTANCKWPFTTFTIGTAGSNSGISGLKTWRAEANILWQCRMQIGIVTNLRLVLGVGDSTSLANWLTADTLTANYAAFRFSTGASDTNWQCITGNNSSTTITDSGVAAAINTDYTLQIVFNSAVPNVQFIINGSTVATNTAHLPTTGVNMAQYEGVQCLVSGARSWLGGWIYIEADY